jgi:inositol transport system substrate-binding protein
MKHYALGLALLAATPAAAQDIGISLSNFDDVFFTSMREGMAEEAEKTGASLQTEDARLDIGRQLSQVQNFVAQGVDAIIVNPVDATATRAMTQSAVAAGIPLIYVNRDPVDGMPAGTWFVGSRDLEGGTLQAQEVCRLLGGKGRVSIIMGDLAYESARLRTQAVEDVLQTDECKGIEVMEKQAGLWTRISGMDLMTNWLSTGQVPDAVIAIQAMQSIGQAVAATPADGAVIVAGFDATADALNEVARGKMATTVFQDAYGQGAGSVRIAADVIKGATAEQMTWIPYQLVTPENYKDFMK